MELQPAHMTETERAQCTTAFKDYKELRELIQLGNLYRLVSPYNDQYPMSNVKLPEMQSVAALMYVNDTKDHAVLFAYGLSSFMKQASRRIRLAGLDPERMYTLRERNVRHGEQPCALDGQSFTGAYLMSVGLDIPLSTEYAIDYPSRIFELR
jgi:alpha-galactosidase